MKKQLTLCALLCTLYSATAQAGVTSVCDGTLIASVTAAAGADAMAAMQVKFTLDMKEDGTASMMLESPYSPPLKGTGKESGNESQPWNLTAKDEGGNIFSGNIEPIKPMFPQDTGMHIMLTLKSDVMQMSGPLTCSMK